MAVAWKSPDDEVSRFLAHGGETGRVIASMNWAATPLGPLTDWPGSLRAAVAVVVRSPLAMALLWGAEGHLLYNDAYAVIAGDRHPASLGTRIRDVWPEAADFNERVLREVLAGASLTYRDRKFLLRRDGATAPAWFTLDYWPALGDAAEPAGVFAVVVETTERVQAEAWRSGERERLRQMFEQSPGFMAMLRGPSHVFEHANPAYMQLVGRRDLVGLSMRDALPELSAQGFHQLLDDTYRTGRAFTGSAMPITLRRDGSTAPEERFVDFVYQPLCDASQTVVGIFLQGADVTDRVLAERAMRLGEVRNRQILDSAVDYAIIAFDANGRVTRWNEGARRIFGWTEEEMLGEDVSRLFTPADRAAGRVQHEMRAALERGAGNDERWHLRRSGERFWATGEMTPLRDDSGQPIGFVKVLRDRTEQHAAIEALRQSESRLRQAQKAGGVGTFSVELATRWLSGSSEFYRIFGIEACDGIPLSLVEGLVLPEDAHVLTRSSDPDLNASLAVEYRIRRANDGALRWIARNAEYDTEVPEGLPPRPVRLLGVVQDITERRNVQRAAEESAAQFMTLAQTLPNQVWTAPADGQLDWFNDRVYEYSGAPTGSLNGQAWAEIVHPDDVPAATERWVAALAAGVDYETEFRLRRADGVFRWHLARALPIRAPDGVIRRWVGTNTDIDERKLAEARSTRDRDRIWTLSQELMLVCDFDGGIKAVNPAAARLLGWSEDEMVGATLADFLHPADIPRTTAEVARLSAGATTLAFENRYRCRDGSWRLLDWTAVPDGGYIHAVARDITGERSAAAERERIWASTNDLMATAGSDGVLRSVNPAWRRLLGHDEAGLVGRAFFDFVDPEDRPRIIELVRRMVAGEKFNGFELRLIHLDDRRSLVAWTAEHVGDVFYLVGRDVTEQRDAEAALRQAQKMEAVGQLTGGIAHDFNNLLQGITGSLALVQKRIAQGRVAEVDRFVGDAVGSARRAAALTHRLLAFARRQPLDPRPVAVNPLIASMEDLLRRTLGERIRLKLVRDPALWLTRCDPHQLESALLNLAINARDAMPDGGVLVIESGNAWLDERAAAVLQDVSAGRYVCISVTDNGIGMSAETTARAFEPFFTTKPIGQGTGLGLSMIYGFARQSEGFAKIYSELGQGTTFKLFLPQHAGDAVPDEPAARPLASPAAADAGQTVLVIEDEPVVRRLIVEVLTDLGYRTLSAEDGPSGLATLQRPGRIDLLVTDMGLPGLNGRQIADAARVQRPQLRVLFMTGYAENAALASGFLEPGMAMITKPFAVELLATRVREMLAAV